MDFSNMSDDELEAIASDGNDYASMSDDELERVANPKGTAETLWDDFKSITPSGLWEGVKKVPENFDRFTGAPVRKFVSETLGGEDLAKAPSGADQARQISEKLGLKDKSYGETFGLPEKYGGNVRPSDIYGVGLEVIQDPLLALGAGAKGIQKAGQGLKSLAPKLAEPIESAGKALYKSGLKRIDEVSKRYGKEPVSDLLLERGVTGSAEDIFRRMDEIGDELLTERNEILKGATRKGAEVDVHSALREAQAYVDRLRKTGNPESEPAIRMLQSRIDEYTQAAAKESQDILRELPTSEYVPEYREVKGFRPAQDELQTLPTSKLVTEAQYQPEVLGYDAPTLSAPGGGPNDLNFSSKDLLRKDVHPKGPDHARFKRQPDENILRDPVDEVISFPQGAQYETKYAPSQDVALRQNPGEVIYGREVPASYKPGQAATVFDQTERISGPSPLQASSWKTTAANKVGDQAWQTLAMSNEGKGFDKALSSGLRRGTEESVEAVSGLDAANTLRQKNSELGRILTSKERALMDAEQEARRNNFTSVDGIITGAADAGILAAKKAADFSKSTYARTTGGKKLVDIANKLKQSPKMAAFSESNPKAFEALVLSMSKQMRPEAELGKAAESDAPKPYDKEAIMQKAQGSKYAAVLQNAAQKGEKAFNAAHFVLQGRDPEYRQLTLEQEADY